MNRRQAVNLPQPMPAHPQVGELEQVMVCTVCRRSVLVGPSFQHLDEATYVGIVCGCFEATGGRVVTDPAALTVAGEPATPARMVGDAGSAGNGQGTAV